ncbi:MAG: acyltransferase family protein [Flavisolibacter sp.]
MPAKRHFHSFDALRFFAFFKVFLLHLPLMAFPVFNFLKSGGGTGVIFFFVLSGFLITYILLHEKQSTKSIRLRSFYWRRILRIWPLYYLMVAFALVTPYLLNSFHLAHSNEGYEPNWLMSVSFLENYQMILTRDHPNVSPLGVTWSLCIEEHFYLVWGLILYFLPSKKLPLVLLFCLVLAQVARVIFRQHNLPTIDLLTNIDYFAFGALPAWLLVMHQKSFEQRLSRIRWRLKIFFLVLTIFYVVISSNVSYWGQTDIEPTIFGLLFSLVLCCILSPTNEIRISDQNLFSRLGLFTYGMYLYHTIIINLMVHVFNSRHWNLDDGIPALAFGLTCLLLTIIISMISYHYFERFFMKWKDRPTRKNVLSEESISAFAAPESKN